MASCARRPTWDGATRRSAARLADALRADAPLAVANEADLGGLAEVRRGAATEADDVLYVAGEVGVGGNVIVDGQPLVGAAGYAGEIGHMVGQPGGRSMCVRLHRLLGDGDRRARMLVAAGRSPDGGRAAVDALIEAATPGEPAAHASVVRVGRWLGLGHRLAGQRPQPDAGRARRRARPDPSARRGGGRCGPRARALPASRELVRVVPGALGANAPIVGAAELAFEPMLADPAQRIAAVRARPPALASA